jgi:hypothetical protein
LKKNIEKLEKSYKSKIKEINSELKDSKEAYELKIDIKERKISELTKNLDNELKEKSDITTEIIN